MPKGWPRIARMGWTLFLFHALIWVFLGVVTVVRMAEEAGASGAEIGLGLIIIMLLIFAYAAAVLL